MGDTNTRFKIKFIIIIWLLSAIISGLSLSAIIIGGSFSPKRLYNVGDIYEVESSVLEVEGDGFNYVENGDKYFTITKNLARKFYSIQENDLSYWNIKVDNLNKESIQCSLEGYRMEDSEQIFVGATEYQLHKGDNIIRWDFGKVSTIVLKIENEVGTKIRFKNFQFMEQINRFSWSDFIFMSFSGSALYLLITGLLWKFVFKKRIKKKDLFVSIIDYYQDFLCNIINLLPKPGMKLSENKKLVIRTTCFLVWIFYFIIIVNIGKRESFDKVHYILSAIIMLIVGLISIEKKLEKCDWNNLLVKIWFVYWIMVCISDFLVTKRWNYLGYFFLIFGSISFLIWGNMKRPYEILKSIVFALHISFAISTFFCFTSRPLYEGYSYVGVNCNPNIFAFYLVMVAAACATQLYQLWENGGKKILYLLLCIEINLICYFMWKSQCRSGLLALMFLGFVFFFIMYRGRRQKRYRTRMIAFLSSVIVFWAPVWEGTDIILRSLPYKLNTVVIFHEDSFDEMSGDFFIGKISASTVQAANSKLTRKIKVKSLDSFFSGRIKIWKSYFRQMNLIGNYDKAKVNGKKRYAHNSFIAIMFLYGVYIVIIYGIMWIIIFRRSIKKLEYSYSFFVFALCSMFFIVALFDAVEQPWRDPIWIISYYIIGYLFVSEKKEEKTVIKI